jgi:hypothetical protein
MKIKGILIIIVLAFAATILIYGLTPEKKSLEKSVIVKINISAANRYVLDSAKWPAWWPQKSTGLIRSSNLILFGDSSIFFKPGSSMYNSINVQTSFYGETYSGKLALLTLKDDSILVNFKIEDLISRRFFQTKTSTLKTAILANNVSAILGALKYFLEEPINTYHIPVIHALVKDTVLISSKFSTQSYPSTARIYTEISKLKIYIVHNNAEQTNAPMLHVEQGDSVYFCMVAIPLNKAITQSNEFALKRMIPGNILVSEARGGISNIEKTSTQLTQYVKDYNLESPAIPFESLITDRMKEKDSSKWITKIYYPIY